MPSFTPTVASFDRYVGAVRNALHLNNTEQYNRVSDDDDEEAQGRIALGAPSSGARKWDTDDEAAEGLLGSDAAPTTKPRRTGSKGISCGLFCKAFGAVSLGLLILGAVKLLIWALSSTTTGLDGMPVFGTSLGCNAKAAKFIYNYDTQTYKYPTGTGKADHGLDIRGDSVGTLTIARGADDATELVFEMTLRSNTAELLQDVSVRVPKADQADGTTSDSRFVLTTPRFRHSIDSACMRYDATLYVPPTLKRLHVQTHTISHIRFDKGATGPVLDDLYVTMYQMSPENLLVPNEALRAQRAALEVYRGWIVGEIDVLDKLTVTSQRGDGTVSLHVRPDTEFAGPAHVHTITGMGRSDIYYKALSPHRQIDAHHLGQGRGPVYLHYDSAAFNGTLDVRAKSYTAHNVQNMVGDETPFVGSKDGADRMQVNAPSAWVGLYF